MFNGHKSLFPHPDINGLNLSIGYLSQESRGLEKLRIMIERYENKTDPAHWVFEGVYSELEYCYSEGDGSQVIDECWVA
jgi:hypothetical protein